MMHIHSRLLVFFGRESNNAMIPETSDLSSPRASINGAATVGLSDSTDRKASATLSGEAKAILRKLPDLGFMLKKVGS